MVNSIKGFAEINKKDTDPGSMGVEDFHSCTSSTNVCTVDVPFLLTQSV